MSIEAAVCETRITEIERPQATRFAPETAASHDLPNLDMLRAVAVGLVFAEHLAESMKIRGLGLLGHFGVLMFFVHTTLVLTLSMGRLGFAGGKLYLAFAVRRLFRIYPLSILAVLVVVAFQIPPTSWLGGYIWAGWPTLLSNVFLIQNITHSESLNSVLWSLPFEVQMCAALPAIYLLLRRFPSLWTASLTWMTGVVVAALEYATRSSSCDLEFLLARYLPCFLAGIVAWRLVTTRRGRLPGALWAFAIAILVVSYRLVDLIRVYGPASFGALHGTFRNDHGIWWPSYMDLINDWLFCGIIGFALPLFAEITNRWLNAITNRIARYSYGVYICHIPVLWLCFVKLHVGPALMSAIISLLLTSLVSIALYHWLEDPAIRYGKWLAAQLVERTVTA